MALLMACSHAGSQKPQSHNVSTTSPPGQATPQIKIANPLADEEAIRATLLQSLAPTAQVERIVISDAYALARWIDGPTGGLATLKRINSEWTLHSTGTRGWPPIEIFAKERGMTIPEAEKLLDQYSPKWRQW